MKKHSAALIALVLGFAITANSQIKVGNNPTTIMNGSLLELEHVPASPKALTLPRMNGASMNLIPSPANGMMVYNTDSACVCYYNGTAWRSVCATGSTVSVGEFWRVNGNTGTNQGTNTIGFATDGNYWGTTDNNNLVVGTNGIKRAFFDVNGNFYGGYGGTAGPLTLTHAFLGLPSQGNLMWGISDTIDATAAATVGNTILGTRNKFTSNVSSDRNNLITGEQNKVNAEASFIMGKSNLVGNVAGNSVQNSIVSGTSNIVGWGTANVSSVAVFGSTNRDSSSFTLVSGFQNVINKNSDNSIAGGFKVTIKENSSNSIGLGSSINIFANSRNSVAIGSVIGISNSGCVSLADQGGAGTLNTTANNQYNSRFNGGYNLFSNSGMTTGVSLAPGGTAWAAISDRRSKNNIHNLNYGLKAVMKLKPTIYNYNGNAYSSIGFIAQEVQQVLPEVVEQTTMGPNKDYLAIKYTEIIPVLTKAIQEQQGIINDLNKRISRLESLLINSNK